MIAYSNTYNYNVCMKLQMDELWHLLSRIVERFIAVLVLIAVLVYVYQSITVLVTYDWSQTDTLYEFIYRVLIAIIGIELVRMLITHSITAVIELIAFVIARKMLKPDLSSLDILLSVIAFVLLMGARHYFTEKTFDENAEETSSSSIKLTKT